MRRTAVWLFVLLTLCMLAGRANAQVTTSGVTGTVKDGQGAVIPGATVSAVHQPSGSAYEAVTQSDGRFFIQGMRVGGPYTVTAGLPGFRSSAQNNLMLGLGVSQDLVFTLELANVSETITVVGATSPIFSSNRTGASTSVSREDLASLPTVSGRINDITRLNPQAGANGSFAGQDNRMNNITIDGSYFNNAFGLGGQPGERTKVAPVSLEAVEQVQVSVAPFDVRQGNFVGAGVNMVTRSGTNRVIGSFYTRYRNQSFVGKEIAGQPFSPGTFTTKNTGAFIGGPLVKNRLFAFGSFEKQSDIRPLSTYRSRQAGEAVAGSVTRVYQSDLDTLSAYLKKNFGYETGDYDLLDQRTPAKPLSMKFDYNAGKSNKVSFRYSQLSSSTDSLPSSSTTAGAGRSVNSSNWMTYRNSTYSILENFKSGVSEWNSVLSNTISNSLTVGYTTNDESRGAVQIFPFVDILDAGTAYLSFGTEPNTPNNQLYYHTFQAQDSLTKFSENHSLTFGGSLEKYHSDNVFFSRSNSVYVYNSLADFYTDADGYLANKTRTTSPVTLNRFQVQYPNIPGQTEPLQQLDSWYVGGYAQDQWRVKSNLTLTAGVRVDTPVFRNTAYSNPQVDALTFRDENGNNVKYESGALPKATPLWSPRVGFNWDVNKDQTTQVRGGTGVFTGKPAYVWISNQIGATGVLTGQDGLTNTTLRPFSPNGQTYWAKGVTGAPATSFEFDVTDKNFKFPQTWRTNIAVDRMLPGGFIATGEYLYNRDVNGVGYINANLPAPASTFVGIDHRPRWSGTSCSATPAVSPCANGLNNVAPKILQAFVLKNQGIGRSWVTAFSLMKSFSAGLSAKGAYSYGQSRNTVDPGSTAFATAASVATAGNPNNPELGFSQNSPGHRGFVSLSYTKRYLSFGSTTVSAFWEAKSNSYFNASNPSGTSGSYVFSTDLNGDGYANNDLIYIPKDVSEMNFVDLTVSGRVFSAAEQAQAFEAYIQQDGYLSKHRGQYAERNGVFLPIVKRMDLSVSQDIFRSAKGAKHTGQIRLDITNFGNLLNHNWGVGKKTLIAAASGNMIPILAPVVDASGKIGYRLATVNGALPTTTFANNSLLNEVYQMMLSFRYGFN
ncbi:MAG: carboxypeptidase regulatory-like domain-containing protein [Vicinamibacterales bacterium]